MEQITKKDIKNIEVTQDYLIIQVEKDINCIVHGTFVGVGELFIKILDVFIFNYLKKIINRILDN